MIDTYLSYEQAAAFFPGKTGRWVRDNLVRTRAVEHVKIGRARLLSKRSLEEWLKLRSVKPIRRAW